MGMVYYSEEVYSKVNKESKMVLEDYMLELKAKGRAVKTIEQYAFDIKSFLCYTYVKFDNKSILELKKREFRNYFLEMQDDGKSSARINRMQSSLRNLLEFCVDDEDEYEGYEKNQMKSIKSLEKKEVRDIVFLTDEQVTYLIDLLMNRKDYQKALFVSLAYDSAGRRNEIIQVEKHSFYDDNDFTTNIVQGKRGKQFKLMYYTRTQEIAKKYLEERGEDDIDELFVTSHGGTLRPLTYGRLYDWVIGFRKDLKEKYDEDIPLNPHSFRHSSAENYSTGSHHNLPQMNREKLEIDELRMLMNHESIEITNSYLKDKDEEILNDLFSTKK